MRESELSMDVPDPVAVICPSDRIGDRDPWALLADFVARPDSDPDLRALVGEVLAAHRNPGFANATRYRRLIDAIPDAITIHDENGRILDANAAACHVYGYAHDALMRLSIADLNPSLTADHLHRLLDAFRLGNTLTVETMNRRGDATSVPVEVHSSLHLDDGGKRIVAVTRDLSARHRADDERHASEARFRLLMQMMDKGMIVQDERGRIVSSNPAACRIFGHAEADMLAMHIAQFAPWQFVDEDGNPLGMADLPGARALRSGKPVSTTICGVFLPKQRVQRWLSVTAVPQFIDGHHRPFQVVSTFGDITAIKRDAELFAQTQALANIGGWRLDFASEALTWTTHMYAIFDLPPATSVTIDRMFQFFPVDDRARLRQLLTDTRGGVATELELRMTSSIGRRRWVRLAARPIRHGDHIHGLSGTLQDITERKLVEENLRRQASTDSLTGLPNRDAMLRAIAEAIASARIGEGPALLYLNLDRFRTVNDQLGHGAGDRLLVVAAERLRDCLPDAAVCARFGGDEFTALLPAGSTREHCERLARNLANEFDRPFNTGDHEFRLTISIGIARHPDDGANVQQLITHAGAAMAEAKRRGRNTWQGFSPDLAKRVSNRARVEQQLHGAIEANEFHLEFQPQIDLASGKVQSAEALLRWNNRELGELRPDMFIPCAEASGDIIAIGAWAIREACRQMRAWRDEGLALTRIAVNVSYRQILGGTLASTVIAALRDYNLPGEALELELTERVLIEDLGDSQQTFATLQGLGVKMVIDDFGEGYSSLGYLRRLPIDGLKISHGFLQNVPGDATDTAICEAIIRIAQPLGLFVIAEGVETDAQRDFLLERGTRLAQGHLFSRALRPAAFAAYVRKRNGLDTPRNTLPG
jgi:diguanylate cyclase (GGDEF)-like protein/PAS domain S-box-containing protein